MTALVSPLRLPGFEYRRMDVEGVMVNHGAALPTGHFLPEEAPDLVTACLRDFLE